MLPTGVSYRTEVSLVVIDDITLTLLPLCRSFLLGVLGVLPPSNDVHRIVKSASETPISKNEKGFKLCVCI